MHLSFSGLDTFNKCPFSFDLKYLQKVPYDKGSLHTAFGKSVHKTIELFLENNSIVFEETFKNCFKQELKELPERVKQKIFKEKELKKIAFEMSIKGANLCKLSIDKLNLMFPGFKLIGVEKKFEEPIIDCPGDYEFKGIIDLIIQTPDGRFHIIDWKTCSWGWNGRKKNNKMVTYQLTYYKHFFSLQNDIDLENVDAHFALIKRTAKKDEIEIFQVPIGERKIKNALKVLNNVVYNIEHKRFIKNRLSCKFCDFHKTVWCP